MRNGKQLLRLLEHHGDSNEYMLRWDRLYLRPATPSSEQIFAAALHYLSHTSTIDIILLDTRDTLIIDNWRTLHGHSPTPEHAQRRHIDRSYLKELR